MFQPIKVLVVDDSALIRQLLTRALGLDPGVEVVGVAKTGAEAIQKADELSPDIITLDIEMPELSGLEALPFLSKRSTARVIMLSSLDDPDTTYQALSSGAVDFIPKPREGFARSLTDLSEEIIKKIKTAYRVDPSKVKRVTTALGKSKARPPVTVRATELRTLVTFASSTGGPPALEKVFTGLTADLPAAYLLVQHLPAGFASSLAERLSRVTDIEIAEARDGERIEPAKAYLAPHGQHMRVSRAMERAPRIRFEDGPPIHGVRPAADPLMESVAEQFDAVVGVILTGMGRDGVDGLAAVRAKGGRTIVQDEDTSVVWGMPGAAASQGLADRVLPVGDIPVEIRRAVRGGAKDRVR